MRRGTSGLRNPRALFSRKTFGGILTHKETELRVWRARLTLATLGPQCDPVGLELTELSQYASRAF